MNKKRKLPITFFLWDRLITSDNNLRQFYTIFLYHWMILPEDSSFFFTLPAILAHLYDRVLKWWRHKNEISEITGFVSIFWKNNVQEAYLPKMSISRQICLWDCSPVILRKLHTNPSNFVLRRLKKKLEGFVWSFLSITELRSQRKTFLVYLKTSLFENFSQKKGSRKF